MKISLKDPMGASALFDSSKDDINDLLKSVSKHLICPTEIFDSRALHKAELLVDNVNQTVADYVESAQKKN